MTKLVYVGDGSFVAGVPARDLSADEVQTHGKAFLLSTGLYQELKTKIYKRKPVKRKPAKEQ